MKKIPSYEVIREIENTIGSAYEVLPKFKLDYLMDDFKKWDKSPSIPRRRELSFYEDFFSWYEIIQSPLYKAMSEEDS